MTMTTLVRRTGNAPESAWPDQATCRKVILAIDDAWRKGCPLSPHPSTRKGGRYAPAIIVREHQLRLTTVKNLIEKWLEAGILSYETLCTRNKKKGLKVNQNDLLKVAGKRVLAPKTTFC